VHIKLNHTLKLAGLPSPKIENMDLHQIKMVMFDMAGTTIQDHDEVLACFKAACEEAGLIAPESRLNALMGVSKLEVFHTLWREQDGPDAEVSDITRKADHAFVLFKGILETYYRTHPVAPVEGALSTFSWLRDHNIKVVLNTGFYREVTDIILEKLDWKNHPLIDLTIASDEVKQGRPAPYMIFSAMQNLGITDPKSVVKMGDTPVDLREGYNAGCLLSLAVTNGTHSRSELELLDNDGLLESVSFLPDFLLRH
jgi:phosphonatase-like hydrolase